MMDLKLATVSHSAEYKAGEGDIEMVHWNLQISNTFSFTKTKSWQTWYRDSSLESSTKQQFVMYQNISDIVMISRPDGPLES